VYDGLVTSQHGPMDLLNRAKGYDTYNRRDSQMVTHSSTSRPVQCLCMAERTEYYVVTDHRTGLALPGYNVHLNLHHVPWLLILQVPGT
jgi:hypothetical protein